MEQGGAAGALTCACMEQGGAAGALTCACMEDVVLHYPSGSADGLGSLLERTEKLLELFPWRTPPAFSPWFPLASADPRLPIRPAKPAPVITESPQRAVSEPPNHLRPAEPGAASPGKPQEKASASPGRRSWSVFRQRAVLLQPAPSKRFGHMVAAHGLHPRQRARWVIREHNCRDVEQAWRTLSRAVGRSRLPTCNANIQRERAEIWVFCDLLRSEQVGRLLKEELQLGGRIGLWVHRLGEIFSM
ncbi:shieldin complex subunit 3 isoform 1-T2 [Odontesthes bonariensis]|uniref:shieldin complex subunit 3 n=1 Tax=Odontesthes bonariensis TaxID=219752 RepID=UPI003F588CC6